MVCSELASARFQLGTHDHGMKRGKWVCGLVFAWAISRRSGLSTVFLLPPAKQEHTYSPPALVCPRSSTHHKTHDWARPPELSCAHRREWGNMAGRNNITGSLISVVWIQPKSGFGKGGWPFCLRLCIYWIQCYNNIQSRVFSPYHISRHQSNSKIQKEGKQTSWLVDLAV